MRQLLPSHDVARGFARIPHRSSLTTTRASLSSRIPRTSRAEDDRLPVHSRNLNCEMAPADPPTFFLFSASGRHPRSGPPSQQRVRQESGEGMQNGRVASNEKDLPALIQSPNAAGRIRVSMAPVRKLLDDITSRRHSAHNSSTCITVLCSAVLTRP